MKTRPIVCASLISFFISGAVVDSALAAQSNPITEPARVLQMLQGRIPNLTQEEKVQLAALAQEEAGVEADMAKPSLNRNPEAVEDLNARLSDIGLQRMRILAGTESKHFSQLRASFNKALALVQGNLTDLQAALDPYIAGTGKPSAKKRNPWISQIAKSCSAFSLDAIRTAGSAAELLNNYEPASDELLAKFDGLLLEVIIEFRKTGIIRDESELHAEISGLSLLSGIVVGLTRLLNDNTSKAASWTDGQTCPEASKSVSVEIDGEVKE